MLHAGFATALPMSLLRSASSSCYLDEWALNVTRKKRARKDATLKELKVYARLFIEAKSAEIKSWFDNDVFDLVDIRKFKPKNFVTGRWALTVKRGRDGKFQKCKARCQQTDSPTSTRPGLRLLCQNAASNGGLSDTLTSRLRSFKGETYAPDRDVVCQLPPEAGNHGTGRTTKEASLQHERRRHGSGGIGWMQL